MFVLFSHLQDFCFNWTISELVLCYLSFCLQHFTMRYSYLGTIKWNMFFNETNRRKTFGAKELSAEKMSEILQKKCRKHFKKKDNISPPWKMSTKKIFPTKVSPERAYVRNLTFLMVMQASRLNPSFSSSTRLLLLRVFSTHLRSTEDIPSRKIQSIRCISPSPSVSNVSNRVLDRWFRVKRFQIKFQPWICWICHNSHVCPGWTNVEEVHNILDKVLDLVEVIASDTTWTVQYKRQINWSLTNWKRKRKGKSVSTTVPLYTAISWRVMLVFPHNRKF